MYTIRKVLECGIDLLKDKPTPLQDALLLLSDLIKLDQLEIMSYKDNNIEPSVVYQYMKMIHRRKNGVSIAHIIGRKEFWGRDFSIQGNTLVPRDDSETIIELFLELSNKTRRYKLADFGTGSGCLLVTALLERRNSYGCGYEIDMNAYNNTLVNVNRYNLSKRCNMYYKSWVYNDMKFDFLLSNPPYICRDDIKNLQMEVRNESRLALDGGINGCIMYRRLFSGIRQHLLSGGTCIVEIGDKMYYDVIRIATEYGLSLYRYKKDLTGVIRCLAFRIS
ncbi:MAG: methyltransferase, HemK family protein [Candidatus Xenolissoclinum pacificiensis L6]|uniref:peptide chain release factor N(5)-glutamine methyltransferase n=1 Tax=Candidatus Xenolissoclinum pacificiensis L6 TaxID=1401685 RepID=W2V2U5_9RICK|nr:MAG: methyltransferase, HemK family protein [Candidatus Xenolissoclinum pacificiensis L6]